MPEEPLEAVPRETCVGRRVEGRASTGGRPGTRFINKVISANEISKFL